MWVNHPRIGPLFRAAVREVWGDAPVAPAETDDLVWLYDACLRAINPAPGEADAFVRPGVYVGGVTLYPLTVQAAIWLDEFATPWWGDRYPWHVLSRAYAAVHGRDEDHFAALTAYEPAYKAVRRFGFRVRCTHADLAGALALLENEQQKVEVSDAGLRDKRHTADPFEWGPAIGYYVGQCQLPPDRVMTMTGDELGAILAAKRQPRTAKEPMDPRAFAAHGMLRAIISHIKAKRARAAETAQEEVHGRC